MQSHYHISDASQKNSAKTRHVEKFSVATSDQTVRLCLATPSLSHLRTQNQKKVDVSGGSTPTTVYVADGIFSVQYWQTNRCFVRVNSYLCGTGEDTDFCTRADCADKRIFAIRTSSAFSCPHTDKVKKELESKHVIER